MSSTNFTLEAHNDQIREVRNADLAHPHLSHLPARMAFDLKDDRLLLHEVVLLERFGKIDLGADTFVVQLLNFLFCILEAVSHFNKLFWSSLEVSYLQVFVCLGRIRIFNC